MLQVSISVLHSFEVSYLSVAGTEAQAAAATVAAAAVAVSLTAVADFPRFVLLVTTPKAAKASSSLARRGSKDATKSCISEMESV